MMWLTPLMILIRCHWWRPSKVNSNVINYWYNFSNKGVINNTCITIITSSNDTREMNVKWIVNNTYLLSGSVLSLVVVLGPYQTTVVAETVAV